MIEISEPTILSATYNEWHRELCRIAREGGGSTSTDQAWMHELYNQHLTPSEAWAAFNNDEVRR
jgi:hypothetical protein